MAAVAGEDSTDLVCELVDGQLAAVGGNLGLRPLDVVESDQQEKDEIVAMLVKSKPKSRLL